MAEVGVIFLLFVHFIFLGMVLRVGIVIETTVGGLAHPVVSSLQLIFVIHVVILFGGFADKLISIGALGSHWEVPSGMFISWLHVLIVAFVAWELGGVGTKEGGGSVAVKEILGMGPVDLVPVLALEGVSIDRVDIEMVALELIVFLVVVDFIFNDVLGVVAALVD